MVKSVLGVNHQGLKDWMVQRASALIMAVYSVGLIGYLLVQRPLEYNTWHALYAHGWMKVATILFVIAVLWHAWIGMWTIYTDYVKCYIVRTIINGLTLFVLFACFFWALQILWGI
jgi:succinate dehydrogenase / fumarate reductase membrane anchor subunit